MIKMVLNFFRILLLSNLNYQNCVRRPRALKTETNNWERARDPSIPVQGGQLRSGGKRPFDPQSIRAAYEAEKRRIWAEAPSFPPPGWNGTRVRLLLDEMWPSSQRGKSSAWPPGLGCHAAGPRHPPQNAIGRWTHGWEVLITYHWRGNKLWWRSSRTQKRKIRKRQEEVGSPGGWPWLL